MNHGDDLLANHLQMDDGQAFQAVSKQDLLIIISFLQWFVWSTQVVDADDLR